MGTLDSLSSRWDPAAQLRLNIKLIFAAIGDLRLFGNGLVPGENVALNATGILCFAAMLIIPVRSA